MIRKILIANRGEIACRIIRTCREMGIATVAVFSDVDMNALHVEFADEAVHIGASAAGESYLNITHVLDAAKLTGVDAIHPGYGFLAENAIFARRVAENGLIFIGPTPMAIEAMGDKRAAKLLLRGIPFVPGYMGEDQSNSAMISAAKEIGFPIMVKATAGGGGKGMRQVHTLDVLDDALDAARREAKQSFGDDTLMLERVVTNPRHVEVQIFGDTHGNVIALGERECTIQRRHQKIVEETPSTALTPELRARMLSSAVHVGQQIGYTNAGTVEFLVDDVGNFYFMEMNTRLQVEHPVTEEVFGLDLVRWQILVAEGYPLPELDPEPFGHAIEVRVYAEDPGNNFLPVIGEIVRWQAPPTVRTDSGVRSGDSVSAYYDPMIAKVIAWAETRDEAIRQLDYALSQLQMLGMRNNISFLRQIITHPQHFAGNITTTFIEEHPELLRHDAPLLPIALTVASLAKQSARMHWRNNPNRPLTHKFIYQGAEHEIRLSPLFGTSVLKVEIGEDEYGAMVHSVDDSQFTVSLNGHRQHATVAKKDDQFWVHALGYTFHLIWISPLPLPGQRGEREGSLRAPMPGQVIKVMVEIGQTVEKGTIMLIMEAMKMEHRIEAPYSGVVEAVRYQVGESVQQDAVLLELKATSL